jgi:hypothetical protein
VSKRNTVAANVELPAPAAPEAERLSINEQEYLAALLRQQDGAGRELQSFLNYLSFRYKLTAQDQVTPDGLIVRGETEKEGGA